MSPTLIERRRILENRIEEAIAMLDFLDGDPDVEESGDEHDVGMPLNWSTSSTWNFGEGTASPILEDDEDNGDTEPNGDERDYSGCEDDHWS